MAATVVVEKEVKFVKNPTATGGTKQATIAGSTDVAGYVYCAVAKKASRRRILNATTNATTTKTTTPATKEVTNLQSKAASE